MKLKIANSDLDENFPIALIDAGRMIVARFFSEEDARKWAALRHYEIQEKKNIWQPL